MKVIRYHDAAGKVGYAQLDREGRSRKIEGDIFQVFEITEEAADIVKILAPVSPPVILGIGLNYRRHVEESGMATPQYPVLFIKSRTSVQNPDDPITIPAHALSRKVDYEGELAVIIGKRCKNVAREQALEQVLGYTCANDVSERDWQLDTSLGGGQWCRGKTFDTFTPLGPCLVTKDEIQNPNELLIRTLLNGRLMQDSNTGDMIFDVARLIEFLSAGTTLLPGTVILTGTPPGVGMAQDPPRWLQPGDRVTVEIEGIGELQNPVRYEPKD